MTIVKSFDIRKKPSEIVNKKTVPYYKLFRFTNSFDKFIIFIMVIASIVLGLTFPYNILIFKDVVNIVVNPQRNTTYVYQMKIMVRNFGLLASVAFIAGFIQMICMSLVANSQSHKYQSNYFSGLLRKEINWFDKIQTGQIITTLTESIDFVKVAISDKLAQFIQQISSFIGSIAIAANSGWKLTLIGCSCIPIMCIIFCFMIHFISKYATSQIKEYSFAGGIAEEILSGIRTVFAFNSQQKESKRYTKNLKRAEEYGIKVCFCQGLGIGLICFVVFSVGALVFYVGLKFIDNDSYEPGIVIQVFLTIVLGSIALGNAAPMIESFMTAKAAALSIFQVIDSQNIECKFDGIIPNSFDGDIVFKNVSFEYPTRSKMPILKNFNLTIPFGKTVAFVGPSGSGKSTIINLIQRFYDPVLGEIKINEVDIKNINLKWYRSNIGVVQQESPIFSGTIRENIKLGNMNATENQVIKATKDANAYEFIMKTDEGFDTKLGNNDIGFSGGQKQRLAIATALIREPKLLLLDEATSALDNKSEKLVQETLDQMNLDHKRTVIIVAHRLQTVRNADLIVVMENGEIKEQGNHENLITQKGLYWKMLKMDTKENLEKPSPVNDKTNLSDIKVETVSLNSIRDSVNIIRKNKSSPFKDFLRLLSINKTEKSYLTIGILASMVIGVTFPASSLIYSEMFNIFQMKYTDPSEMLNKGNLYSGLLLIPGFALLISQLLKNLYLGKAGEILTTKLRHLMMESILKQEIAWFEDPQNSSGVLTTRLAIEASLVKGSAGIQMSVYIEAIINIIAASAIGFYYSWEISLIFWAFFPFITISGILQGKLSSGQMTTSNSTISSSALVLEVVNNIRIVYSFGLQEYFYEKYLKSLQKKNFKTKLIAFGIVCGIGSSAMFYAYCVVFYVGGILMDNKTIDMNKLMRVFSCFIMSSAALGQALALAPNSEKAKKATRNTLETIDRESLIETNNGIIPIEKLSGKIEFKNINFYYPRRKNNPVLKNFNLCIEPGQKIALIGHSGCGKSTIIQLLERYYDLQKMNDNESNQILLDGYDLKSLNLNWVRSQLGLVKQEPTLFNISILENIKYGSNDFTDMKKIESATKMANIYDFINSLTDKFDTIVGQRGQNFSGGQKQRICIARALYNQPGILLLDEATSALDNDNQFLVQQAIENAQVNSTSITIAHKLSTVINSDIIVMIEDGEIVESGTHNELIQLKGRYYDQYNCN